MRIEEQLPPEFDLPPESLARRRAELVEEISRAPWRSRSLVGGVPAVALAAVAVLALTLAWPFGGGRGGVLERALAAVGRGPVLHVVREGDWGGTLVDLKTGERTHLAAENEVWYDAERNLVRRVSRFAGVVETDISYRPKPPESEVVGLGIEYQEALRSGAAQLAGEDVIRGKPVVWIKVRSELLPDVADNRLHELAWQVAVSRRSYVPVATRETRDGDEIPNSLQWVLKMENVTRDAVDFDLTKHDPAEGVSMAMSPGLDHELPLSAARGVLDGDLLWAGGRLGDLPFARAGRLDYKWGYTPETKTWPHEVTGVGLAYGNLDGAYVLIREVKTLPVMGFGFAARGYRPPDGSVLLTAGGHGFLHRDGVYVSIDGPSDDVVLAAARSLEPVSAGSAARR